MEFEYNQLLKQQKVHINLVNALRILYINYLEKYIPIKYEKTGAKYKIQRYRATLKINFDILESNF